MTLIQEKIRETSGKPIRSPLARDSSPLTYRKSGFYTLYKLVKPQSYESLRAGDQLPQLHNIDC